MKFIIGVFESRSKWRVLSEMNIENASAAFNAGLNLARAPYLPYFD
jgi:hypothetical protein